MRYTIPYFIVSAILLWSSCKSDNSESTLQDEERKYFEDYIPPQHNWGYIDEMGKWAIKPIFDDVREFSEELGAVNLDGKWGYIAKDGEVKIEPQFRSARSFTQGRAIVQKMDLSFQIIKRSGDTIPIFPYEKIYPYSNDLALVIKNGYYGYIDTMGNEVIECKYEKAQTFELGKAIVSENGKAGIISKEGHWLIAPEWDDIKNGNGSWVVLQKGNEIIFHNLLSEESVSFEGTNASGVFGGVAIIQNRDLFIMTDTLGNPLSSKMEWLQYAGEKRWIYAIEDHFGLLSHEGQVITEAKYEAIYPFKEGRAVFSKGDFWGYLDADGNEIVPAKFPLVWDFKNSLARVIYEYRIGFINKNGYFVIPPSLLEVKDFSEGLAGAQYVK